MVIKIQDPGSGSASKSLIILIPNFFYKFSENDPGCSSRIRIPDTDFFPIPDPEVKEAPDPGSATLLFNAL
jgi:hypothetical protein